MSFTLNPIETDAIKRNRWVQAKGLALRKGIMEGPLRKYGPQKDSEQVSDDSGQYQDHDGGLKTVLPLFSNKHCPFFCPLLRPRIHGRDQE